MLRRRFVPAVDELELERENHDLQEEISRLTAQLEPPPARFSQSSRSYASNYGDAAVDPYEYAESSFAPFAERPASPQRNYGADLQRVMELLAGASASAGSATQQQQRRRSPPSPTGSIRQASAVPYDESVQQAPTTMGVVSGEVADIERAMSFASASTRGRSEPPRAAIARVVKFARVQLDGVPMTDRQLRCAVEAVLAVAEVSDAPIETETLFALSGVALRVAAEGLATAPRLRNEIATLTQQQEALRASFVDATQAQQQQVAQQQVAQQQVAQQQQQSMQQQAAQQALPVYATHAQQATQQATQQQQSAQQKVAQQATTVALAPAASPALAPALAPAPAPAPAPMSDAPQLWDAVHEMQADLARALTMMQSRLSPRLNGRPQAAATPAPTAESSTPMLQRPASPERIPDLLMSQTQSLMSRPDLRVLHREASASKIQYERAARIAELRAQEKNLVEKSDALIGVLEWKADLDIPRLREVQSSLVETNVKLESVRREIVSLAPEETASRLAEMQSKLVVDQLRVNDAVAVTQPRLQQRPRSPTRATAAATGVPPTGGVQAQMLQQQMLMMQQQMQQMQQQMRPPQYGGWRVQSRPPPPPVRPYAAPPSTPPPSPYGGIANGSYDRSAASFAGGSPYAAAAGAPPQWLPASGAGFTSGSFNI
tara:strand:+ start:15 stop:2003 length:1989 start_codon:yes stop_codon:yes gene_type:complete